MDTAHKTDEEKKEHFDTPEKLDEKITMLAEWIKASKHFVVFTGAGISTSAGIPDYRSGVNTVLPTGPGAWEKMATKTNVKGNIRKSMASAVPTPCHMALVKLMEAGYLKFVVSQNVDGLHRKSGIPAKNIAEVHGNTNVEVCKNKACKKQYLRDFRVRTAQKVHDHKTGRKCENCGQDLHDSIINFGENLPERDLNAGFEECAKADLCLVLGSSLRVTPAADMPASTAEKGGRLVIVNLQSTPLDREGFRVNGLIDDVLIRLMKKLGLTVPSFVLKRRMMVMKSDADPKKQQPGQKGKTHLMVRGVDEEGSPYSLFKFMIATFLSTKENFVPQNNTEPFRILPTRSDMEKGMVKLQLGFQGHYEEPVLDMEVNLETLRVNVPVYYMMEFDPQVKKWISCKQIAL